jgi:hypothetical protein
MAYVRPRTKRCRFGHYHLACLERFPHSSVRADELEVGDDGSGSGDNGPARETTN